LFFGWISALVSAFAQTSAIGLFYFLTTIETMAGTGGQTLYL